MLFEKILSSEVATKYVFTIHNQMTIFEAIKLMYSKNIRHLPVLDQTDLIEILTLTDIIKVIKELRDPISPELPVTNIMILDVKMRISDINLCAIE